MNYCVFSETSDVYVYPAADDHGDYYTCGACLLATNENTLGSFMCDTVAEMLMHLRVHIMAGHRVPQAAIDRLMEESK